MPKRSAAAAENERPQLTPVNDGNGENPVGDPVESVMGDLGALADELRGLDEGASDSEWDEPILPPEFDVFQPTPGVGKRIREAGGDPTCVRILVHPVRGGVRQKATRRLRPEGVTYARLQAALSPGRWDIVGYSIDRCFIGSKRITVTDGDDLDDLSDGEELETLGASGKARRSSSRQSPAEQLVWQLAMKAIRGNEAAGSASEIREAIGAMVKMQTLQLQMQQTELANRLKLLDAQHNAGARSGGDTLSMIKTVFELADRRSGRQRGGGGTKPEDFIGMLQMGMHFQKMMSGDKPPEPDWAEKFFIPALQELGPGIVTVMAMLFPDDKAKPILEMLEQHLRTREAEAKAAAAQEPETYDTTAEPVGEQ